ncbi:MAG: hypothetical protein KGZ35_08230 [Truepera sp.]|nr:hypothetical protein [Truepera sp.]
MNSSRPRPAVVLYICGYGLWLGFSALALWLLTQLRVNLVDLAYHLRLGVWGLALHNFGMLFLAICYIVFVIVLEAHLRRGVELGELWLRALGVLLFLLYLLGISYGLQIAIA